MCGIAGIMHDDRNKPIEQDRLARMTSAMSHRGPDGGGSYTARGIGLGHRRLAVIDLATGHQPMRSVEGNLTLVFNGEIYNYIEIRKELEALGHRFTTASDTEVILAAYQQWGFDCQLRFNGMWAFALWDASQRQLFISRDRMGEKPLHYAFRDGTFLFGSEIKSILAYGWDFGPATEMLHVYLSLGYVPAPYTFFRGISRVEAGHFLVVRDGRVQDRTYWELPQITEDEMRTDAERIYDEFKGCFLDSVKIRMRSDVPYGAFLSGGLDSASVVAAMSAQHPTPINTFTIGFSEKAFDERHLANEAANWFGTNHHERLVAPEMFDDSLQSVLSHFDEPFGDASAIPVGLVSSLARQKVTMVLTGDGGDEVLSGYTSYLAERLTEQYRNIPAIARWGLTVLTTALGGVARGAARYRLNRASRFMTLADATYNERSIAKLSMLEPQSIRGLIPDSIPQISIQDYLSSAMGRCAFDDPFYRLMYFNLKVSLPDDMLTKVDRMSMAHSLEARIPFLDHRLVDLTYRVHKKIKMPRLRRKHLLRHTFGHRLPPNLLKAPKMPFSVPLREWFKHDDFTTRLNLLARSDFGLNCHAIGEIVDAHRAGRHDYGDFIWRLFILKEWLSGTAPPRKSSFNSADLKSAHEHVTTLKPCAPVGISGPEGIKHFNER
jgi:asparagine synthase (glutamine-hydrolysing)